MSARRKTGIAIAVVVLLVVAFGAIHLIRHGKEGAAEAAVAPVEVDVASVVHKEVSDWQSYTGRLQAIDHVDIHALVPGTIEAVYFRDGQVVKKGDMLFLIDPRPYKAALDHALAAVDESRANAKFAQTDFDRAKKLIATNAMSKRDFDEKSNLCTAALASVKLAEADVEQAKVNLEYTHIAAPVAGRMSRAEFTVGNIVSAGTGSPPLTTLVSISPIYAAFDIDEQTYLAFMSKRSKQDVAVRLSLANETGFTREGKLYFVDNQLNSGAGTIRVRAIFDNPDGVLVPGLLAKVLVDSGQPHQALLVDDRAISTDQAKKFVLLVDPNNHAQYREVTLGPQNGGLREITSGLQAGDRIVVSGIQRIHPGDEVQPRQVPMAGEVASN